MRHFWLLLVVMALRLSAQTGVVISGPAMPPAAAPVPPSNLKPEDLGSIEGQVVNSVTGERLNKANLILNRTDRTPGIMEGLPTIYSTTSDTTGRFVFRELGPGQYMLSVTRNGFVTVQYGSKGPMRPGTSIAVDRGKSVKAIDVRLVPHGVITGRILDEDGDPQANVQVQLARIGYMQGRRLMPTGNSSTNDLGEYRIFGVAPGKYVLAATYMSRNMMPNAIDQSPSAQQNENYVPTYYPGTTDLNAAVQIEVAGGATLSGINMKLAKARTVRVKGQVSQSIAPGQQTISVFLMPRRRDALSMMSSMNRSRIVGAQGDFEIIGITPGSYLVRAELNFNGKSYSGFTPVEVGTTNLEGVKVSIGAGAVVAGRVLYEGDPPANVQNAQLLLVPREPGMMMGGSNPVKFNADGSFQFEGVAPDVYNLFCYGLPEGYYIKSVRSSDRDLLNTGIDTSSPVAPLEVLLSPNAGQLTGTVQNSATQQPAAGAFVVMVPQENERRSVVTWYKTVVADQRGNFTFKGLTPGEYKVFAWEDIEPGAYMDPDFVKPVESRGESVTIREGSAAPVHLTLIRADEAVPPQR